MLGFAKDMQVLDIVFNADRVVKRTKTDSVKNWLWKDVSVKWSFVEMVKDGFWDLWARPISWFLWMGGGLVLNFRASRGLRQGDALSPFLAYNGGACSWKFSRERKLSIVRLLRDLNWKFHIHNLHTIPNFLKIARRS